MDKFGSSENLTDDDTKTRAPAWASVIKSLVGRAAVLAELSAGTPINNDGTPITRRNPSGRYGVDLSGPPWGAAKRHPLMIMGGITHPQGGHDVAGVIDEYSPTIDLEVYVRPFAQRTGAPYSRGYFRGIFQNPTGVSQTISVTIGRYVNGASVEDGTINVALGTTTAITHGTHSALWVPLTPKGNRVWLRFSTTSSTALRVIGVSLNQIQKLSH